MSGKSVPQSTAKQEASRMRLLNRKLDSREASESSWFSLLRKSSRRSSTNPQTNSTRLKKTAKYGPMADCAKACTELSTPERVRNVPKIHSKKVAKMRPMFQTFI